MKKTSFFVLLLLAGISLSLLSCSKKSSGPVSASNAVEALKARGELILGFDDSFPPLTLRDENNEVIGFDIDLASEVAKRLGVTLKTKPIDWDVKYKDLENGTIDCIWCAFTITEERKRDNSLTFPYLNNEQIVLVRKGGAVKTFEDLQGRVIGYRSSTSSENAINGNPTFKNMLGDMITYKTNNALLADLKVGLLDAVVIDSVAAHYYIAQTGEPLEILPQSLAVEEYAVCFRKSEPELRDEVEKILLQMGADGTAAAISAKWFGKDVTLIGR